MNIEGILSINDFKTIMGFEELTEAQELQFKSANLRATWLIENLLGWSFSYKEIYEELAQNVSKQSCVCPTEKQIAIWENAYPGTNEKEMFRDADSVDGVIRLFPYNNLDEKIKIDPCKSIYKVKLVKTLSTDRNQFFTVRELEPQYWMQAPDEAGIIRYVEHCSPTFGGNVDCNCEGCLMLAVDADYLKTPPDDLTMLLAELVLSAMKSKPTLTQSLESEVPGRVKVAKSESVSNHSVSYDYIKVDETQTSDYSARIMNNPTLLAILKRYCGPYSPLYQRQHIR